MHFVHLDVLTGDHSNSSPDCSAIALRSHQLDFDPVLLVAAVVTKQRRRIVQIQNDDVHVSIVVVVSKGRPATVEMLCDARSHGGRNIFESPVAQILVDQARVFVGLADSVPLDFRVDVSVDLHNVLPAVVVHIDKPTTPGHVLIVDANAGRKRNITESSIAVIVIEVAGVVREVGFENVEPPVAVVICNPHTHASLLVAIFAVRATGHNCDIGERAVVIVVKQNARL